MELEPEQEEGEDGEVEQSVGVGWIVGGERRTPLIDVMVDIGDNHAALYEGDGVEG